MKTQLIKRTFQSVLVLTFVALMMSCIKDDVPNVRYELSPIDTVAFPADTLILNKKYEIEISYLQTSSCQEFNGFTTDTERDEDKPGDITDEDPKSNTILVGALMSVYDREDCQEYDEPKTVKKELSFEPIDQNPYIFKFWQGVDENEEPIFLEKTIYIKKEE